MRAGYVLRLFLLCSVLFILEASSYMENEAGQVPPQWRELVGVAVVRWYSWMAVLPFIDRVARDTTPRSAWSLALHAGIAATFIAAHIGVVVAAENVAALGEQSRPFMLLPRLVPDAILYTLFAVSLTILESRRRRAGADARMRAALAEARLEALRQQLNPHFLFNTLNHIVMQVRLNETADALRMLLALSDLLHIVLADRAQLTTVRREMESVELYLEIERARFGAKLQVEATIDAQVLDALVPSFLLQPLLENAMRHGVSPVDGTCRVRLAVRPDRGRLTIEVRDDGPGPSAVTSMGSGIGLANTRERLRHLYDDDHHFDMRLRDSTGTIVTLDIPLRKS